MRFREIKNIGPGHTAGSGSVCLNSHSSCYDQSARMLLRGAMHDARKCCNNQSRGRSSHVQIK